MGQLNIGYERMPSIGRRNHGHGPPSVAPSDMPGGGERGREIATATEGGGLNALKMAVGFGVRIE